MDTKQGVADVLLEFIEAVIHQILFVRELYSPELFERQRLYGVAVRKARHPELSDYIHDVITSLKDPLIFGTLSKVAIVILDPNNQPSERHIIEPRLLVPDSSRAPQQQQHQAQTELLQIEAQLRGFLLKLQYMDSYLDKVAPGSTFEIVAYTIGRMGVPLNAWSEEQPSTYHHHHSQPQQQQTSLVNDNNKATRLELEDGEVVPVKSCRIDNVFQLQLYSEREAT